jgi:hypothetical protein
MSYDKENRQISSPAGSVTQNGLGFLLRKGPIQVVSIKQWNSLNS